MTFYQWADLGHCEPRTQLRIPIRGQLGVATMTYTWQSRAVGFYDLYDMKASTHWSLRDEIATGIGSLAYVVGAADYPLGYPCE